MKNSMSVPSHWMVQELVHISKVKMKYCSVLRIVILRKFLIWHPNEILCHGLQWLQGMQKMRKYEQVLVRIKDNHVCQIQYYYGQYCLTDLACKTAKEEEASTS